MSEEDYKQSRELERHSYSFAALIMSAIRKADDFNLGKLESSFPDIFSEFRIWGIENKRYKGSDNEF